MDTPEIASWIQTQLRIASKAASHLRLRLVRKEATHAANIVAVNTVTLPENAPKAQRDVFESTTDIPIRQTIIRLLQKFANPTLDQDLIDIRADYSNRHELFYRSLVEIHTIAARTSPLPSYELIKLEFDLLQEDESTKQAITKRDLQKKSDAKKANIPSSSSMEIDIPANLKQYVNAAIKKQYKNTKLQKPASKLQNSPKTNFPSNKKQLQTKKPKLQKHTAALP